MEKEITIPEDVIREIIEKEVSKAKFQIEEHMEETIEQAHSKTERAMERLSNEKIKAIDEFSNTVIDRIYKNHEEAVFLYDMLSNKQVQIKHNIADLEKTAKEGIRVVEEKLRAAEYYGKDTFYTADIPEGQGDERNDTEPSQDGMVKEDFNTADQQPQGDEFSDSLEEPGKAEDTEQENKNPEPQSDNKNKVLELRKNGKTDLEIAKELGLGIGEVKLIIGLFE